MNAASYRRRITNLYMLSIASVFALQAAAYAEVVQYEVTFDSNWSAATHPVDYPAGAHYSSHVGATHNQDFSLWAPGELASPGMKALAERGVPSPSDDEVQTAIENGSAYQFIQMSATPVGERSRTFRVSDSHPLISMATMIAPSPDWFVGFHDVDLRAGGDWVADYSADAWPYDSGTDSGATYQSANLVTENPEPIFRITTPPLEGAPRFGEYRIRLASVPGDLNESGEVDAGDIAALCAQLGESDPRFEYSGDNSITVDDLSAFVEARLETRLGDANLDGEVGFDDFLSLSENFGRDFRDWARGDFNCDSHVEFADFLILSRNFGFPGDVEETNGGTAASVPEPSSFLLSAAALSLLGLRRKRSRGVV